MLITMKCRCIKIFYLRQSYTFFYIYDHWIIPCMADIFDFAIAYEVLSDTKNIFRFGNQICFFTYMTT